MTETKALKPLTGIRGWLLFFLLTVTVFTPMNFVYHALTAKDSVFWIGYHVFDISNWMFGFICAVRMWKFDADGLRLMRRCLWIALGLGVLYAYSPTHPTYAGLVYPIVWLAYLKSSQRVKNTYGQGSVTPFIPIQLGEQK
jgi:hypothetical protein